MWNQLLPLHNVVYKCLVVLIVLIVNSVERKRMIFVKIELEIMSASIIRDYTKVIIVVNQLILFSIEFLLIFYHFYRFLCVKVSPISASWR